MTKNQTDQPGCHLGSRTGHPDGWRPSRETHEGERGEYTPDRGTRGVTRVRGSRADGTRK